MTTIMWFRQDLRLADNPALAAAARGGPVVPVYLFAPAEAGAWAPGGASRWWLHRSLERLARELADCGSRLILRASDDSLQTLRELVRQCGATRVVWNRRYEPASIARDQRIKAALRDAGIDTESFNSALLHEPWTVKTKTGGPFQVFTPFWRHCKGLPDPGDLLPAPTSLAPPARWPDSVTLQSLDLEPQIDWTQGMQAEWQPGNAAAHAQLEHFLGDAFDDYKSARDQPAVAGTSRLSPYLHVGAIGPREIWHATRAFALARGQHTTWRDSHFLAEVGWREFAYHLLYHFPHTPEEPLRDSYARFPWQPDTGGGAAWQRGRTGYPIVDAGMRQLWHTGWMHNRVRMIAASFFVKDLLLPWTAGARWFWDSLVDADLASNTLGWQWVAGCGADAAPYFRVFNPVLQGERFDPQGTYVRRWVPELSALSEKWIHQPWNAPTEVLRSAGVSLGRTYPHRIIDHDVARARALEALATLKNN